MCFFCNSLTNRINAANPPWKSSALLFISSVGRLLEILLDYRNVLQGDENRDKRMSCTLNLLNFYKNEINRKEMYVRYIYKLHDLNLSAENFAEAGFTLLLHAQMLGWSDENLPAMDNTGNGNNTTVASLHCSIYPVQTETQRKEAIYLKVLNYFDKGKVCMF